MPFISLHCRSLPGNKCGQHQFFPHWLSSYSTKLPRHDRSNWIDTAAGAMRVLPSVVLRGLSVPFLLTTSKVSGCWLRNSPPPPPPPLCQRGRGFLPSTKRHHVSHFYPLSLSLHRLINRTLSRGDNRAEYTISHLPTFYTVPPEWPLRG